MGQCVVRDCGYDPARRMNGQTLRPIEDDVNYFEMLILLFLPS